MGRGAYNLNKKEFLNKLLSDADQIVFESIRLFKLQSVAKYRIFFNTSYRGIPEGRSYPDVFCLFVYRGNGRVTGRAYNLAYKRKFTVYKKRNSLKQKMRRFCAVVYCCLDSENEKCSFEYSGTPSTDTRFIRTVSFVLIKSSYILSKINPLYTHTG